MPEFKVQQKLPRAYVYHVSHSGELHKAAEWLYDKRLINCTVLYNEVNDYPWGVKRSLMLRLTQATNATNNNGPIMETCDVEVTLGDSIFVDAETGQVWVEKDFDASEWEVVDDKLF